MVSDHSFGGDIKYFSILAGPKKLRITQNSKGEKYSPIDVNGESPLIEYLKVSKLLLNVPINYIPEYEAQNIFYNKLQRLI